MVAVAVMKGLGFTVTISLLGLLWTGSSVADTYEVDYTLQWQNAETAESTDASLDSDTLYRIRAVESSGLSFDSGDFRLSVPHSGLTYLTRFRVHNSSQRATLDGYSQNDAHQQLVSSLYQIGYGASQESWFGGLNVSVEQFDDEYEREEGDLWSLGLHAGSRFALTGLGASAPLWTLSLVGEYDRKLFNDGSANDWVQRGKWFITPGVHWVVNNFSLTAGVQMPLDERRDDDLSVEDPDYRLRADFEHRF